MLIKSEQKDKPDSFVPKSSFLELVSYDDKAEKLTVTFKTGNQRVYPNTSKGVYLNFKQAVNHSVYYSKLIKGSTASVAVVSHNVSTRKQTQPLTKQPGDKPYGSNALNRKVRDVARGKPAGNLPKF